MIIFLLFRLLPLLLLPHAATGQRHRRNTVAIQQRPLMINHLNLQRSALKLPLLCQDSLLTSMAQQHANNMAALDRLAHDLPCRTGRIPDGFCLAAERLARFARAAENVVAVRGNETAAVAAMQIAADQAMYANSMSREFLYVGVGVAYNAESDTFYWAQMFSNGDYVGVNCTLEPEVVTVSVRAADAKGRLRKRGNKNDHNQMQKHKQTQKRSSNSMNDQSTNNDSSETLLKVHRYTQPQQGLNLNFYPRGIINGPGSGKPANGYYCSMIAFDPTLVANGTAAAPTATLSIGSVPYPTVLVPDPQQPAHHRRQLAKQRQERRLAQKALLAAISYLNSNSNSTATATVNSTGALNDTLHAVGVALQQSPTLIAGLVETTDTVAYSALYSQVTSILSSNEGGDNDENDNDDDESEIDETNDSGSKSISSSTVTSSSSGSSMILSATAAPTETAS